MQNLGIRFALDFYNIQNHDIKPEISDKERSPFHARWTPKFEFKHIRRENVSIRDWNTYHNTIQNQGLLISGFRKGKYIFCNQCATRCFCTNQVISLIWYITFKEKRLYCSYDNWYTYQTSTGKHKYQSTRENIRQNELWKEFMFST